MNVIERIHMLKKILKEAGKLVTWQENIYTALHNIHADWIVSGTIAWGRLVANFPRTIAELLSDHDKAAHDALDIDADTVDGDHKADLEGTMDTKITAHAGVAAAHHAVHLKTLADHPLSVIPTMDDAHIPAAIARDTEVDSKITTHKGDASAHHAKTGNYEVYANTELVTSLPGASATYLGRILRQRTGAGIKTTVYLCVQNDADGYEWIQIGIST